MSLGYRVSVVPTEDAGLVLPTGICGLTVSAKVLRLSGLLGPEPPLMLLQRLTEDGGVGAIQLRVAGSDWFQLIYRRDLDGAIEFSPVGARHHIKTITVNSPADEFGWLHPTSAHPFVLDGQLCGQHTPKTGRGVYARRCTVTMIQRSRTGIRWAWHWQFDSTSHHCSGYVCWRCATRCRSRMYLTV